MHTRSVSISVSALILLSALSCRNNPLGPEGNHQLTSDSLTLSFEVNNLPRIGIYAWVYVSNNLIYPDPTLPDTLLPKGEVVVAINQSFNVKLVGCPLNQVWYWAIEDTAMKLVGRDSLVNGSHKTLSYRFNPTSRCSGSIAFCEVDANGAISNNTRGLIISYVSNPLNSIELELAHQDWSIDTLGGLSLLHLYLSGTTNAFRLKVEGYGDGLIDARTIIPSSDGSFAGTFTIAFSYGTGGIVRCNGTRIAAYGVVGMPIIQRIANPLSP
jgi:hypothetical protein